MTGNDTIAAISTPAGVGGIAVIRVSGPDAVNMVGQAWKGKNLEHVASHTVHLGKYVSTEGNVLDEGMAAVFRAPHSYTGEDVVELSVHGSRWIQRELINDLIRRGARAAGRGEFTQRAFLNGKLDLAQAEGVADLIAASSKASHRMAISQTKGAFSRELDVLRDRLIEFVSLLELELDFSEEDVEFADRGRLLGLARRILDKIERMASSYASGAAIKNGVAVVIAGIPNAGKSSLLNLLLGEEKAIVTDIPGTTRDSIEDTIEIDGILYRFIDTAGLRESADKVESIGIDRARDRMRKADVVIWVVDGCSPIAPQLSERDSFRRECPEVAVLTVLNKSDLLQDGKVADGVLTVSGLKERLPKDTMLGGGLAGNESGELGCGLAEGLTEDTLLVSALTGDGTDRLLSMLREKATKGIDLENETIISSARHFESLTLGAEALRRAITGIESDLPTDMIAQDIRETLHHLGTITGQISTPDILQSIFTRFCIGK